MIDLFSNFGTSTALLLRRKSKRWTSFKRFVSKKERTWRLKNLKIKEKIPMSSSYHVEWKTFTEVSFIYNIYTRENIFRKCWLWRLRVSSFQGDLKKCSSVWCKYNSLKYCLCSHLFLYQTKIIFRQDFLAPLNAFFKLPM